MTDVEMRADDLDDDLDATAGESTPATGPHPTPTPNPGERRWPSPTRLAVACWILYAPFTVFGYGTDVDITNLLRSGQSLLDGSYRYSRPPGAFPYEALVGVLDRAGGPAAIALASSVMAVVLLVALGRLVGEEFGERSGRIAVIVVATQPWFWIAATSLGDYVYALGLLLVGVLAARHDRRLLAGLAFATAVGFRSGTVLLVGAYLGAEMLGPVLARAGAGEAQRRPSWSALRPALLTAAVSAGIGILWFVPPWLSVGRTTRFLMNDFETTGIVAMAGRWAVKNVAFFGVVALVVLLGRAPVVLGPVRRFRDSTLIRFAVLAAVAAELLFFRFPWKPVHLLPAIVAVAVLLAANPRTSNRLVGAVVAANVALAVVSVTIAEPDVANASTTGTFNVGLTRGVVLNDLDCRIHPPFAGTWPDLDRPAADYAAIDVFTCQARSWRAGGIPDDYGDGSRS